MTSAQRAAGPTAGDPALLERTAVEDLLVTIYLHTDWRAVTRHLTTEQRELFADALDSWSEREGSGDRIADRWWMDSERAFYPYCCEVGYRGLPGACVIHRAPALLPPGTVRT